MKPAAVFLSLVLLNTPLSAAAQSRLPFKNFGGYAPITAKDRGPDIDPQQLLARRYTSFPYFWTFRNLTDFSRVISGVWICAAGDSEEIYKKSISYTYPEFYYPTWREVLDHAAAQMECSWRWNSENRQFEFDSRNGHRVFEVTPASGWQSENRGLSTTIIAGEQGSAMDIYYFGSFTLGENDALAEQVLEHYSKFLLSRWPEKAMPSSSLFKPVNLNEGKALFFEGPTPGGASFWLQWSFLIRGHAFLAAAVTPTARLDVHRPQISSMVQSIRLLP